MQYKVNISREALAAMLMNGLETFLLPMGNKGKNFSEEAKGHEVFGHIFGTIDESRNNTIIFNVRFINFDITARSTQSSISTQNEAKTIKQALAEIVLPGMKLLGNFHTHPYRLQDKTLTEQTTNDLYTPSPQDSIDYDAKDKQLDFILAVANAQRKLQQPTGHIKQNCVQLSIDNIRFYLAAYVRRKTNEDDYPIYIDSSEVRLIIGEGMWRNVKHRKLP